MIEKINYHMFLEFGLLHSKILDCLELLSVKELQIHASICSVFFTELEKSSSELKMEPKPKPWQP